MASNPASLLDGVRGLLGQKLLDVPGVSETALRYLQNFGFEVSLELVRVIGIVMFAETFRSFPFVLLGSALVQESAYIQPNLVGLRHLTRLEPHFQGSHEKSMVGPKVGKALRKIKQSLLTPVAAYTETREITVYM